MPTKTYKFCLSLYHQSYTILQRLLIPPMAFTSCHDQGSNRLPLLTTHPIQLTCWVTLLPHISPQAAQYGYYLLLICIARLIDPKIRLSSNYYIKFRTWSSSYGESLSTCSYEYSGRIHRSYNFKQYIGQVTSWKRPEKIH